MTESEEEEWNGGSGDEGQTDECHDEVVIVESSTVIDSAKPILCLSERNEEDTTWTRNDDTMTP